jgi:hypothetical protein
MSSYTAPDWIETLATNLLTNAYGLLVNSPNPPTTKVLSFGTQAIRDCACLSLTVDQLFTIRPSFGQRGGFAPDPGPVEPHGLIPAVSMKLELIQCGVPGLSGVTVPIVPPAEDVTSYSQDRLVDAWLLYRGLMQLRDTGSLYAPDPSFPPLCQRTKFGPLVPSLEGDLAVWTMTIQTNLA